MEFLLPLLKIGVIVDSFHTSENVDVVKIKLNKIVRGVKDTCAQSINKKAGILCLTGNKGGLDFFERN